MGAKVLKTLYITENHLQLKKRSNRIAVKKKGKIIKEIHTQDLKRIIVFGNSQFTTELMRFLAGKGVEVAFLSSRGKFQYRLAPELSKNIYLRMAQHDRYRNETYRMRFCTAVIKGKIKNQRTFLQRYQRYRAGLSLDSVLLFLKESIERCDQMKTVDQLRGVEGAAGRQYFDAFGKLLLNNFEFHKRRYHPPPDPVNAMLGFAYMLLFNEIESLLEAFGFDVYLGLLHGLRYGRKSLASDLIEEFRSPVADRLVLYLINKGIIQKKQFTQNKNSVKMDENARKAFLANYENFMTAAFQNEPHNVSKNYREILRENIQRMEDAILNNADYKPFHQQF